MVSTVQPHQLPNNTYPASNSTLNYIRNVAQNALSQASRFFAAVANAAKTSALYMKSAITNKKVAIPVAILAAAGALVFYWYQEKPTGKTGEDSGSVSDASSDTNIEDEAKAGGVKSRIKALEKNANE